MAKFILFFFLLTSAVSYGSQTLSPPPLNFADTNTNSKETFQVFPISSEIQIGKIMHFLENAPQGVLLTVGSERGFRAASMMPKITYLILLDYSDEIIRYNLINIQLLHAPTRQEYLTLRWNSDFQEWHKYDIHLTQKDFDWWQQKVRNIDAMPYKLPEYLNKYNKSPDCQDKGISQKERKINLGEILDYKTGNYLFYDNLYNHLHQLAVENRIFTSKIDLLDDSQVNKLIDYLKQQKLTISVLDFDNLYYKDYLGQKAYYQVVNKLLALGNNDSILIAMSNYKRYACGQYQNYIGFTFEHVKHWKQNFKMQDFFDSFPSEVNDLINGRLYEGNEKLPVFQKSKK